jgi:hypothetical protein
MPLVVYCADIGSVKKSKFGWARLEVDEPKAAPITGNDIGKFADRVAEDLNAGQGVALGFECPLFVPVSEDPAQLTSPRPGERNRGWSAGAGATALAAGLSETVWILDRIKRGTKGLPKVFVDWAEFREHRAGLFLWEAFVTGDSKAESHAADAKLAVETFRSCLAAVDRNNAVVCTGRVRSLFGAALLQTGWVRDLEWLTRSCVVLRV